MALAVALGAATVASGVGLLATSAYVISAAALHPSIADLSVAITGVRFFGLARGVFRYLERYVSHSVNFRFWPACVCGSTRPSNRWHPRNSCTTRAATCWHGRWPTSKPCRTFTCA
jgi:hypothetical protein